ncbi:MAG TPA: RNA polymerase sigma factor, partial [Steroidobacteraceae bacterium]|nr:RNA polymerase sigma factor [Steroidobacteraceae bacterium]
FTAFMRAYQDMVFTTAVRLTSNAPQAEDIAQEVFLRAYENFERLRSSPAAGGWLKTVAIHLALNHITRYRRRWRLFTDVFAGEASEEALESGAADVDELFAHTDAEQRRVLIEQALEQLPAHQRVPLVLYHFEEMPYRDIAQRLGVSLAKVKTDILRARVAMAALLARRGFDAAGATTGAEL